MRVNGSTWGSVFGKTGMDPLHPQVEKKKFRQKIKLRYSFVLISFSKVFVKLKNISQKKFKNYDKILKMFVLGLRNSAERTNGFNEVQENKLNFQE